MESGRKRGGQKEIQEARWSLQNDQQKKKIKRMKENLEGMLQNGRDTIETENRNTEWKRPR